jgi:cation-transporting ATPase 13A2
MKFVFLMGLMAIIGFCSTLPLMIRSG